MSAQFYHVMPVRERFHAIVEIPGEPHYFRMDTGRVIHGYEPKYITLGSYKSIPQAQSAIDEWIQKLA